MTEKLVALRIAVEEVAEASPLQVLDRLQVVRFAASWAIGLPSFRFAGQAGVEPRCDGLVEFRPRGVVAVVAFAAVDRVVVADRVGEEEVVAGAAFEAVAPSLLSRASSLPLPLRVSSPGPSASTSSLSSAPARVSFPAPPVSTTEVVSGKPEVLSESLPPIPARTIESGASLNGQTTLLAEGGLQPPAAAGLVSKLPPASAKVTCRAVIGRVDVVVIAAAGQVKAGIRALLGAMTPTLTLPVALGDAAAGVLA